MTEFPDNVYYAPRSGNLQGRRFMLCTGNDRDVILWGIDTLNTWRGSAEGLHQYFVRMK